MIEVRNTKEFYKPFMLNVSTTIGKCASTKSTNIRLFSGVYADVATYFGRTRKRFTTYSTRKQ